MADSKPLPGAEGTPADTKPGTEDAAADGASSSEQVNIKVRLTWMVVLLGCSRLKRSMGDGEGGNSAGGGWKGRESLEGEPVSLFSVVLSLVIHVSWL